MDLVKGLKDKLDRNVHESAVNLSTKQLCHEYGFNYPSDLTVLSAYVYPYLDEAQLQLANNWHMWLWKFDDIVDDHIKDESNYLLIQSCVKKLEAPLLPLMEVLPIFKQIGDNPPSMKLLPIVELLDHVISDLPPEVKRYLCRQAIEYINLGVEPHMQLTEPPSLENYLTIREYDGACETVFPLMLLDSPELVAELESHRHCLTLANRIISLTNDLYSYPKDVYRDKTFFNYVYLVSFWDDISLQEAEARTSKEIIGMYQELSLSADNLIVKRLLQWVDGNFVWHKQSSRYRLN